MRVRERRGGWNKGRKEMAQGRVGKGKGKGQKGERKELKVYGEIKTL